MRFATHDLRYAVRGLRTRPGFTAAVVATLAIGIGASTAMFSLIDAALLRRLPFAEPDRVAVLWGVAGPERDIRGASLPEARDWAAMTRTLDRVSVYDETSVALRTTDGAERVDAEMVSASYFPLLGAAAERGRVFLPEEDAVPDARPVVVVSRRFWTARLGGDPAAVGRTVTLNDRPFTVVGVMPGGFRGLSFDTDVWFPTAMASLTNAPSVHTSRGSRWLMVVGRLAAGRTAADAQRDLDDVARRLTAAHPESNTDRGVRVMTLVENYLGATGSLLRALFAAVLLFLLVTCANVVGLQLVRATARQREVALRLALGAERGRLVRQLLTEGVVLATLGGAAGALLAAWGVAAARPWIPDGLLPPYAVVAVDGRALAFALLLALTVGVLCGLAPAFLAARDDLTGALRDGARGSGAGLGRIRRPGAQQALVAGAVALAVVLLAGAGVMTRSLVRQLAVRPGFDPAGVVAARLSLPPQRYPAEERAAFVTQLNERLAALPGARGAAVGSDVPLGGSSSAARLTIEGLDTGEEGIRFYRHAVAPGYLDALRIPIVRGRGFTAADRRDAPPVAVVSAAMARRYWPSGDPVGAQLRLGGASGALTTVVGVAGDARFRDLTTDLGAAGSEPDVYFPFAQRPDRDLELVVRSRGTTLVSAAALREAVAAIDPTLPVYDVRPLGDGLRRQSAAARFGALVLGGFSGGALLLAAIGIYGVIAFVVGLSRREIAIRIALGARTGGVAALVVRNGMTLASAGLAAGLVVAALGGRLLAGLLFEVQPTDPLTFTLVALLVLLVALVASWIPARRAARLEPLTALKTE